MAVPVGTEPGTGVVAEPDVEVAAAAPPVDAAGVGVPEALLEQVTELGRFVTPAEPQICFANLSVASWSDGEHASLMQQLMESMKEPVVQMHLTSMTLQDFGIEPSAQFLAQSGSAERSCDCATTVHNKPERATKTAENLMLK